MTLSCVNKHYNRICDDKLWKWLVDRDYGLSDYRPDNETSKMQYMALLDHRRLTHIRGDCTIQSYCYNKFKHIQCLPRKINVKFMEWLNEKGIGYDYISPEAPLSVLKLSNLQLWNNNVTDDETAIWLYEKRRITIETLANAFILSGRVDRIAISNYVVPWQLFRKIKSLNTIKWCEKRMDLNGIDCATDEIFSYLQKRVRNVHRIKTYEKRKSAKPQMDSNELLMKAIRFKYDELFNELLAQGVQPTLKHLRFSMRINNFKYAKDIRDRGVVFGANRKSSGYITLFDSWRVPYITYDEKHVDYTQHIKL